MKISQQLQNLETEDAGFAIFNHGCELSPHVPWRDGNSLNDKILTLNGDSSGNLEIAQSEYCTDPWSRDPVQTACRMMKYKVSIECNVEHLEKRFSKD